jgi:hypothetical protein
MKGLKFLYHFRKVIRKNQFRYSSEKTCVGWLNRFILFHNQRHQKDIDSELDEIIIRGGTVYPFWWYRFGAVLKGYQMIGDRASQGLI